MWDWPEFPVVKQKLVDEKRFDRNWKGDEGVSLSTKGAHMPIMIFTCGESWRSPEAEKERQQKSKARHEKSKLKARSRRSRSQHPQDEILGFDAVAAESSGSAAVAAEPGPAWVASEPGPAAFAPEAGLDQWLPANLPIGTANFFQPHDTEQQRIDNAIQQHYARMAGFAAFGEYSPGFAAFGEYSWRRLCASALAVRWRRLAETQPLYLPLRGLDASEPQQRNYDTI